MELPPLAQNADSRYWSGAITVPWYRTDEPVHLTVIPPDGEEWAEPRPSTIQRAAFNQLMRGESALREVLLERFQHYVPELKDGDWAALEAFFQLRDVRLLPIEKGGRAYVGLVFTCLQWDFGYEHGAGIILCGDRLVHFGMAEEAETAERAYIDAGLLAPDEDEEELDA